MRPPSVYLTTTATELQRVLGMGCSSESHWTARASG